MVPDEREASLRLLIFREGSWFVAQCLEYDIAAQARTLMDVQYEFERILAGRFFTAKKLGVDPFEGIPPAPEEYRELFNNVKKTLRVEFKQIEAFPKNIMPPPFMLPENAEARLYDC